MRINMKMTKRAVTFLAASAVLVSQVVMAAPAVAPVKLTQVQGDVMVNNGTRFVKAVPGLEIKPGAKIVTAKSSNASLVYQNGCVKALKQNTMHTVGSAEQCAVSFSKERTYVAALGEETTTILGIEMTESTAIVVGGTIGVVVGVGSLVGLVDGFTSGDGDNYFAPPVPASP
jgi:hypothetical protein